MMDRIRALPVELVYERFMEHATQRQMRMDEVAADFPDAPEGSFSYPLPTFEQFKRMWGEVLADVRLMRFWAERLALTELHPSGSESAKGTPGDQPRERAA